VTWGMVPAARRRTALTAGLAGLALGLLMACARGPVPLAVLVFLGALMQASRRRPGSGAEFLRVPTAAAGMTVIGALLEQSQGGPLGRLAAVLLVLGLTAGIGLVPHLPRVDSDEPPEASHMAWSLVVGPVFALSYWTQLQLLLAGRPEAGLAAGV